MWRILTDRLGRPSARPSIWQRAGCNSHFWTKNGRVDWRPGTARPFSGILTQPAISRASWSSQTGGAVGVGRLRRRGLSLRASGRSFAWRRLPVHQILQQDTAVPSGRAEECCPPGIPRGEVIPWVDRKKEKRESAQSPDVPTPEPCGPDSLIESSPLAGEKVASTRLLRLATAPSTCLDPQHV